MSQSPETDFPGWTDRDWFCSTIEEAVSFLVDHEMGSSEQPYDIAKDEAAKAELIRRLRRMANRVKANFRLKPCTPINEE